MNRNENFIVKLLAAAALILAITAVAALATKLIGHHTTCTTKSQGFGSTFSTRFRLGSILLADRS
jgi:hypothetical protein